MQVSTESVLVSGFPRSHELSLKEYMVHKPAKQSNQAGLLLLLAVGASLALAVVFGPSLYTTNKSTAGKLDISNSPMLSETIGQLNSAESSSMRMNAARWISTQFSDNPDTVINSLGNSLNNDPDPIVRAQAANSLANIARQAREKTGAAKEQKEIADLLTRQYHKEASDTVRRCIIGAAAELDNEHAGPLVDEAINDNDPAVKEEALRARLERERRAQLKKLG